jgi:hypothetical protein
MDYTKEILGVTTYEFSDFSWILKLPLAILIAGIIFYNLMMFLRIRILADTVDSNENIGIKRLAYIHTILSLVGCLVSLVLILLG